MNNRGAMFAQAARGPVLLITVGVLFALEQSGMLAFSRSWPLLIIVVGVMKLIERLILGPQPYPPPAPGYPPPPAGYAHRPPAGPPPGGSYQ